MYNPTTVKESLSGLVGIRQVHGTQYETLSATLTDNVLFYLNDTHPLIEMENIVNTYRNAKELGYVEYSAEKTYAIGERVLKAGIAYESLSADNTGNDPVTSPLKWKAIKIFSEQLEQSISSSIDKLVQSVFIRKKLNELVRTTVDDFYLYDGRAEFQNKNANNGRFVGFKINTRQLQDLSVIISKISFQIDTASPDLKLYIYSTANPEPLKVIPINYNPTGAVKWFDLKGETAIVLSSFADGDYIIGYFETDMAAGAQSIKKETNLVEVAYCGSCNGRDYDYYQRRSKYMDIQPFYVDAENLDGTNLWDDDKEVYLEKNNFGMNLSITVSCDLTDFITRNKNLFAEALALQAATDILLKMQYSSKDNQQLQKLKTQINYALYGDKENFNVGLVKSTEKAIAALDFDLSSLNSVCLPKNETQLIGRRVV